MTVSIGVSSILMAEDAPQDELVACADRALYLAKTRGRSILGQGAKKDCRQCWRGGSIVLYAPFF